jgi:hypothetical protein
LRICDLRINKNNIFAGLRFVAWQTKEIFGFSKEERAHEFADLRSVLLTDIDILVQFINLNSKFSIFTSFTVFMQRKYRAQQQGNLYQSLS